MPKRKPNTSQHISPLEAHLGYWLRVVSNRVSGNFAAALLAQQFTVVEWVALRLLHDGAGGDEMTPAALASRLGMTRGAITKVLDKLESKGLVRRIEREDDRRSVYLSLSPAGRCVLPQLAALADDNDARCFDCLESNERAQLQALLAKLAQHHGWNEVAIE